MIVNISLSGCSKKSTFLEKSTLENNILKSHHKNCMLLLVYQSPRPLEIGHYHKARVGEDVAIYKCYLEAYMNRNRNLYIIAQAQ